MFDNIEKKEPDVVTAIRNSMAIDFKKRLDEKQKLSVMNITMYMYPETIALYGHIVEDVMEKAESDGTYKTESPDTLMVDGLRSMLTDIFVNGVAYTINCLMEKEAERALKSSGISGTRIDTTDIKLMERRISDITKLLDDVLSSDYNSESKEKLISANKKARNALEYTQTVLREKVIVSAALNKRR